MLQSIAKYFRALQNIIEYYRVFLAHLLGPIFGLVYIFVSVFIGFAPFFGDIE